MTPYEAFRASVAGGDLAGGVWRPEELGTPVLAIHGITSTHRSWPLIADRLPGVRVIAPDLRGRGRSNTLRGPWGMRQHAEDMARVLDRFEVERAVLVGHSMGGFVAVRTAAQHPDRVAALVLVDGGLPLPFGPPADVPPEDVPALLLGPAGERLSVVYPSRDAYEALWRAHPAFTGHWSEAVADYVAYDLDGVEGGFRPSARFEAVAANIVQLGPGDGYREAFAGLSLPIDFLRAPRGLVNQTPGLYPDAVLAEGLRDAPAVRAHDIIDVNHYTILLADAGADQVAPFVRNAVVSASGHEGVVDQ